MGMSLEETEQYQYDNRVSYLASLFGAAARHFLNAASLLEINSPVIKRLKEMEQASVDMSPLFPLYDVIVRRYNAEVFSPQVDWIAPEETRPDVRWSRYYYYKLIPRPLEDNEFVRNVLRATEALACKSYKKARVSLLTYCEEFVLPDTRPLWGSSVLVEDDDSEES